MVFPLAYMLIEAGRLDEGKARLETLRAQFMALGDQASIGACYRGIAMVCRMQGDLDEAAEASRRALEIATRIGDRLGVARALNALAELPRRRGDWQEAEASCEAFMEIAVELGDTLSVLIGTANLGLVHGQLGAWEEATEDFDRAVELARSAGTLRPFLGAFLGCSGHALARAGRMDAAIAAIEEALSIDADTPIAEKDFLESLEGFAACAVGTDLSHRVLTVAEARWASKGDDAAASRVRAARGA